MLDRILKGPALPGESVDPQTAYTILSEPRRRWVVRCLAEANGGVRKGDLAEALANHEADPGERIDTAKRKAALVSLHQTHLPKLVDADVVQWDGRGVVTPTARCDRLAAVDARFRRLAEDGR